jgi:hypothetical protein
MIKSFRILSPIALALALSNCAVATRISAAGDVQAFLISIRDGDRASFDAHVDRSALKEQIRARLMAEGAKRHDDQGDLAALGVLIGKPLIDTLADRLIEPDVFRAVAEYFGYSAQTPIPNQLTIAQGLRPIDDTHVCVARKKDAPCILMFRNEDGVWRLISFEGDPKMLRTPKHF